MQKGGKKREQTTVKEQHKTLLNHQKITIIHINNLYRSTNKLLLI